MREALCGGSQESISSFASAFPLVDTVTDLNVAFDQSNPLNRNRQGFACKSENVSLSGNVPPGVTQCNSGVSIGTMVNGQACGTSGCPY